VDYRVLFTEQALNDLAGIIARIAEDDPEAACRFGAALLDHVDCSAGFLACAPRSAAGQVCANSCIVLS
jgi:plasmid stabilization system protein ParE